MKTVDMNLASDEAVRVTRSKREFVKGKLDTAIEKRSQLSNRRSATGDGKAALQQVLDGDEAPVQRTDAELCQEIRTLTTAYDQSIKDVAEAECQASWRIAEAAKPAYEAILAKIAKALRELRKAAEEELAFRRSLSDNDISYSAVLRTMPFAGRVDAAAPTFLIEAWLKELATYYPNVA